VRYRDETDDQIELMVLRAVLVAESLEAWVENRSVVVNRLASLIGIFQVSSIDGDRCLSLEIGEKQASSMGDLPIRCRNQSFVNPFDVSL